MAARENIEQQTAVLLDLYRFMFDEGDVTRAQLKAKMYAAAAVVEDGTEVNAVAFEGGSTQAIVMYPKEVVIAAARQAIREIDAAVSGVPLADPSVVHSDLSRTRLES